MARERYLLLLVVVTVIINKTSTCSMLPVSMPKMHRFTGADFVIKGEDLEHFTVLENGRNITKARFQVHCIFKPDPQTGNISDHIIIRDVGDDKVCTHTYISPGEILIMTLTEAESCAGSGCDCEFELQEVNPTMSAGFLSTETLMIEITQACEFQDFHSPNNCTRPRPGQQNMCPVPYTGECYVAASGIVVPGLLSLVGLLLLFIQILC